MYAITVWIYEGDIWFFGFAVLVTFEIGFSVFALKIPGISVLVSITVFGFSLFGIRVSVFMNKKSGYSVLASKLAHCTNLLSSSRVTKVSPSYETETMEKAIPLIWLNIAKIFFGIMRIKFALQAV